MTYGDGDRKRIKPDPTGSTGKARSEFRRDYGRLLHSPAFRRLQGKTQLFPGHESDFFRNRLTHSLEVAQVAKGIALYLNESVKEFKKSPIDTDLVEFAALAHDLGHPPFGHNGERALDDCMKVHGGFEGNAQTLRILARIEKKVLLDASGQANGDYCGITPRGTDLRLGLNLTFRSLASVLKYNKKIAVSRAPKSKLCKGYYASEESVVNKIKRAIGSPPRGVKFKTVECQIMDLADDIAYSTYDLEDAMKAGFSHPLGIRAKLVSDRSIVKRIHKKVVETRPDATLKEVFQSLESRFDLGVIPYDKADDEADDMEVSHEIFSLTHSELIASQGYLRVSFTSSLVSGYLKAITVSVPAIGKECFAKISLDRKTQIEIESLKHLNYELMIMAPRLKVVEFRGYELIQTIFKTLDSKSGYLLLPEDYRLMYTRLKNVSEKKRLICDFVAGMTDRYAIEFYGRLKESGASIFKPI